MIASNPNLMVVIGCTGDEASAVVPLLDANHTPMFCLTGQSEFNKSSFTYFHRLIPPDAYEAYAMVGIALFVNHYTRIALVFGNDIGSQTFVGPAQKAIQNLGGTVVVNQALALGQSSYRTEVEKLIQANPQVILTEAMGPTGATYLSELKQLNHGLIPLIGTSSLIDPAIFQSLAAAVGVGDLVKYVTADSLETTFSGVAFDEFKTNLLASSAQLAKPDQYLGIPDVLHEYDGIVMTGLAMVAAKSTDPKVYNSWIVKVGNGYGSSPTVVNTYKEGLDALSQGKTIKFVGAGGPTLFDQWNNSQGGYVIVRYDTTGAAQEIGKLTPDQVTQLVQAGGG
jgi:branched-chain amino acid transport system substrate-binding protein